MLRRVYGVCSDMDSMSRDCLLDPWLSNYANLQNSFFNLDDQSRSFIGTNFPQIDETIKSYLIYKGILEAPKKPSQTVLSSRTDENSAATMEGKDKKQVVKGLNYSTEYLLATVEILSFKIEAAHMQRVLMGWISGEGKIPNTTSEYTRLMRKYQDITTMRIL